MTLNTITLKLVSERPIPADVSLADLALMGCGHVWPVLSMEVRNRQATGDETARAAAIHVPLEGKDRS